MRLRHRFDYGCDCGYHVCRKCGRHWYPEELWRGRCGECNGAAPKWGEGFAFDPDADYPGRDPLDPTNGDRAAHAEAALEAFLSATGEAPKIDGDAVRDLFADLLHYCDREGLNARALLAKAGDDWELERGGGGC